MCHSEALGIAAEFGLFLLLMALLCDKLKQHALHLGLGTVRIYTGTGTQQYFGYFTLSVIPKFL